MVLPIANPTATQSAAFGGPGLDTPEGSVQRGDGQARIPKGQFP